MAERDEGVWDRGEGYVRGHGTRTGVADKQPIDAVLQVGVVVNEAIKVVVEHGESGPHRVERRPQAP